MSIGRSVVGALERDRSSGDDPRRNPDDLLSQLLSETRRSNKLLEHYLRQSVATLETIVFQKSVVTPDPSSPASVTVTIQPQSRQLEVIEGFIPFFINPAGGVGTNFTAVTFGDITMQLSQNSIYAPIRLVLESQETRSFTLQTSSAWKAGDRIGLAYWGRIVPATLGDVLS